MDETEEMVVGNFSLIIIFLQLGPSRYSWRRFPSFPLLSMVGTDLFLTSNSLFPWRGLRQTLNSQLVVLLAASQKGLVGHGSHACFVQSIAMSLGGLNDLEQVSLLCFGGHPMVRPVARSAAKTHQLLSTSRDREDGSAEFPGKSLKHADSGRGCRIFTASTSFTVD